MLLSNRPMAPTASSAMALAAVLMLVACTDPVTAPGDSIPTVIEVSSLPVLLEGLGEARTLSAQVLDQRGRRIEGVPLVWEVADPEVLELEGPDVVRAVGNGESLVVVRVDTSNPMVRPDLGYLSGRLEATVPVVVRQRAATVQMSLASTTLWAIGQRMTIAAEVFDPLGQPVQRALDIVWVSGDSTVVKVDAEGEVTAQGDGSTAVSAVLDGRTETVQLVVSAFTNVQACASFRQPGGSLAPEGSQTCDALPLRIFHPGARGN